MLGAIIGDIVGSRFEWDNIKTKEFELFDPRCRPTDDSIMTLAVAKAIIDTSEDRMQLEKCAAMRIRQLGRKYPDAGYGGKFYKWLFKPYAKPYNSYGNGAAMRVSPCGFAASSVDDAIAYAHAVTRVTHNHPEGMKAAESVAVAIYLARSGASIAEIRRHIEERYYRIDFTLDDIREDYTFDVTCQGSVPQAFEALFESTGFEDAIRNAISIGGDSDTIAAITGGMAEACYGIPEDIRQHALEYLDEYQLFILQSFEEQYGDA